jgi:hypothetical protein
MSPPACRLHPPRVGSDHLPPVAPRLEVTREPLFDEMFQLAGCLCEASPFRGTPRVDRPQPTFGGADTRKGSPFTKGAADVSASCVHAKRTTTDVIGMHHLRLEATTSAQNLAASSSGDRGLETRMGVRHTVLRVDARNEGALRVQHSIDSPA